MAGGVWLTDGARERLLRAAEGSDAHQRREALARMNKEFTLPTNPHGMPNLLHMWRDSRTRKALLAAAADEAPWAVRREALILLRHLTFHQDNLPHMWCDETLRRGLIAAAAAAEEKLLRLEALAVLRNLTFADENLRGMWAEEGMRSILLAAAAPAGQLSVRREALATLANLTMAPENLPLIAGDADVSAVLVATAGAKQKDLRTDALTALSRLGIAPPASPSTLTPPVEEPPPPPPLVKRESSLKVPPTPPYLMQPFKKRFCHLAPKKAEAPPPPPPPVRAQPSADFILAFEQWLPADAGRGGGPAGGDLPESGVIGGAVGDDVAGHIGGVTPLVSLPDAEGANAAAASSASHTCGDGQAETPSLHLLNLSAGEREYMTNLLELLPDDDEAEAVELLVDKAAARGIASLLLNAAGSVDCRLVEALLEHAAAVAPNATAAVAECWASLSSSLLNSLKAAAVPVPTGFFYDERCMEHLGSVASDDPNILDKPQRVQRALDAARAVRRSLPAGGLRLSLQDLSAVAVDADAMLELVRLAHTDKYVHRQLRVLREAEGEQPGPGSVVSATHDGLEHDTYVSHGSMQAIVSALNVVKAGVDGVLSGSFTNAFCCVRPPGHHVGRDGRTEDAPSQGFCFFNNVAVAAKYAADTWRLRRIAVVDFDVHHGNGTQEILAADSRFLFVSAHTRSQAFYPGTGAESWKNVINMPLSLGFSTDDFLREWSDVGVPGRIAGFQPELLILSAGFDAHRDDPSCGGRLDTDDFLRLTEHMVSLAWGIESCHGRLLSVLEGGYDTSAPAAHKPRGGALQRSVAAHLQGLLSSSRLPSNASSSVLGKRKGLDAAKDI